MIPDSLRVRAYQDNEGQILIGFATPQPIVEAAMERFDQDRQDRELAEKLVALDSSWATQELEDRIHELERDGDLAVSAMGDRLRTLRVASIPMVVGALVVGILIGRWLL